ncbi:subtilisin-like serine protease [Ceratobasidium sp. 392]|nr:subtilisin-like serine protease [Ceratobasidium sp. 392]
MSKTDTRSDFNITNEYDVLGGYSAYLSDDIVAWLKRSPHVAMVVPDIPCSGQLRQTDAPWGISRISRRSALPSGSSANSVNYLYRWRWTPSEREADVYIVDTGANTDHEDFGGRARWGATFGEGYPDKDDNGHGTHIAGTVAGERYGVAKNASIIAVKVLGANNRGYMSNVIAGVNWATEQALASRRPSVINISIASDEPDPATDRAVTNAVNMGMHVIVAAGNTNQDYTVTSPARASAVTTVGATNIQDERWFWSSNQGSNFGRGIDVFAPGEDITSAWIGSNSATNRITGTSMATAHVSGLVAYLLALEGSRSPEKMRLRIQLLGSFGILTRIPSNTPQVFPKWCTLAFN